MIAWVPVGYYCLVILILICWFVVLCCLGCVLLIFAVFGGYGRLVAGVCFTVDCCFVWLLSCLAPVFDLLFLCFFFCGLIVGFGFGFWVVVCVLLFC